MTGYHAWTGDRRHARAGQLKYDIRGRISVLFREPGIPAAMTSSPKLLVYNKGIKVGYGI